MDTSHRFPPYKLYLAIDNSSFYFPVTCFLFYLFLIHRSVIILKIPEAGTSSCFLCRLAEQTKPATSKMSQFEVQLMHGSDG